MRKIILGLTAIIGVLAILGATSPANASVNIDSDGKGFVGKGDVQTALGGINNEALQTLVGPEGDGVKFTYVTTDTYEVVNAWATGNVDNPVSLNKHEVTVTTTVDVNAAVNYDARKVKGQKQWTGFNLIGFGSNTTTGTIPTVSKTIAYQSFSWDTTAWDGTYDIVPNPNYDPTKPTQGNNTPTKQVKHYVTTTHTTDQMPVDENGNLYTEGNNKAVVSVEKIDSTGGLFVDGHALPNTSVV